MIQANELRIGNIINNSERNNYIITSSLIYGVKVENKENGSYCITDQFCPIHITEEWLLKLGFKSVGLSGYRFELNEKITWCSDTVVFAIETDGNYFYPMINHTFCCFTEIKYVHQLQNLYFALTGKELTIKPQ